MISFWGRPRKKIPEILRTPRDRPKMIFIVAKTQVEAIDLAIQLGYSSSQYRYVYDRYSLRGIDRGSTVLLVGKYYTHPEWPYIHELCVLRSFKMLGITDEIK